MSTIQRGKNGWSDPLYMLYLANRFFVIIIITGKQRVLDYIL